MIETPYLLFLGDAPDSLAAKVAQGIRDWRPEAAIGQYRMEGCNADMGLPDMTIAEAVAAGARTLVVGVANRGGVISPAWLSVLSEALGQGLDVASGLHNLLRDEPELVAAAMAHGRTLHDVRVPDRRYPIADGGMTRPSRADPGIVEQRCRWQVRLELGWQDAEVDLTNAEALAYVHIEPDEMHGHARRNFGQSLHDRTEQQESRVIARADPKRAAVGCRRERLRRVEQVLELSNAVVNTAGDACGELGQLEISANAHQQLVAECVAKAGQHSTHRWLTQKQPLGGARDVLFFQERVERHKKIQIELPEIH